MEQTRRDPVIELLCAGHHPAAIIKLLKYPRRTIHDIIKKWEESGMSKRKEHKPRSDRICTPTFVAGLKRSINANPGTPMSILAEKRGQDSSPTHKAKFVHSWLRRMCTTSGTSTSDPPNSPDMNPCDYYLLGKLEREVCATNHSNVASLKASIKSETNKLDPADVSKDCERFRRRLEDILEAEGGHIE
ncbi:Transposable element tcb2 transposase [Caligus rogercresseyi]|uniref:Transposable element tcb2 transposase n=1 Tax=Caligus rogercresseyi TaxID=217165 RepID=A0A7T8GW07_CALRO|nr:Transposable element tcb2 transposase [Caligus rogercresseyi]